MALTLLTCEERNTEEFLMTKEKRSILDTAETNEENLSFVSV